MALLTMALLTVALLTMALLTMALLTMALLTVALLTMAALTTLTKVGGGCSELGGGAARHLEFVNVAAYTGEPVLLLETEQSTARWLAAMGDAELLGTVVSELRLMFPGAPSPVSSAIPPNPKPKPKAGLALPQTPTLPPTLPPTPTLLLTPTLRRWAGSSPD